MPQLRLSKKFSNIKQVEKYLGPNPFGPNEWLVDDMYERYSQDPFSVNASWREFFGSGSQKTLLSNQVLHQEDEFYSANAVLVQNMQASMSIPTATSSRVITCKYLEANRQIINDYLLTTNRKKVSYTHLISYAIVKALANMPNLNSSFLEDTTGFDSAKVIRYKHLGLGLAVDHKRNNGSRTLIVPCIAKADTLSFKSLWQAELELVEKVQSNHLGPNDFTGTTVTITNPGVFGTSFSIPRLLNGQGLIVAIGAIGYPGEYKTANEEFLRQVGISKTFTITSTYDHRIIQGAESGEFLAAVEKLLLDRQFYEEVFDSLEISLPTAPTSSLEPNSGFVIESSFGANNSPSLEKELQVQSLVNSYRTSGHLIANLDPLGFQKRQVPPELDLANYSLTIDDLERRFFSHGLFPEPSAKLKDIIRVLQSSYCSTIGVEYMHIQDQDQKNWIRQKLETFPVDKSKQLQIHLLDLLTSAEAFERFLHSHYVGQKRFGLEGAESAIVVIASILDQGALNGLTHAVLGMAHRGRLNVLANIIGLSYGEIFSEFEPDPDPSSTQGSGDVKYHRGAEGVFVGFSGNKIKVSLSSNPSHLEAVDPVVEGITRAKQDKLGPSKRRFILPLLIHGDAAFAGQGVVAETLNLAELKGYRTAGTIHLVINNQLGFTTSPSAGRSSTYATDVAKMIEAPILHVNGDDPQACETVARLAMDFRQKFSKDIVIDMLCYRRHGHSEIDEPGYTQPRMYNKIEKHKSVRKLYDQFLLNRGDITIAQSTQLMDRFASRLQAALDQTRSKARSKPKDLVLERSLGFEKNPPTAVSKELLDHIARSFSYLPPGFVLHPKLEPQLKTRAQLYAKSVLDWSMGESLAIGSLLLEGIDVRLSGQDSVRGTFSQRHAVLVDYISEEEFNPLEALEPYKNHPKGKFFIYNSSLSEYGALGFEYGYSLANRNSLVIWEAQFGDFANVGQTIIDNFIASSEEKWGQKSGLVLFLPHGLEGQGPEHSSARIERFLSLCANGNMQVVNPTTSGQLFHLLRGHGLSLDPKPLVVFSPKSLLRSPDARCDIKELTDGSFRSVIDDLNTQQDPDLVKVVVLCSGKFFYDLENKRNTIENQTYALVRIEQLYPWPETELEEIFQNYGSLKKIIWAQEEPENIGPWPNLCHYFYENDWIRKNNISVQLIARTPSTSVGTPSRTIYQLETKQLVEEVFSTTF